MSIGGLPAPAAGSVALSAVSSVLVCTAGLTLLSGTRPADVGGRAFSVYMKIIFGVFGALLLFVGLVLSEIPMLMGVSTDSEGKLAGLIRCLLVLACWSTERYLLAGQPLDLSQSCACAFVWFGSTLVQWAGPRPHDNISLGLDGQIAGCDGGYRSPFFIYASFWVTSLVFGTLLLLVALVTSHMEDDGPHEAGSLVAEVDACESPTGRGSAAQPSALRAWAFRTALPTVYGFATSMSGLSFAAGAARAEMAWVLLGAMLLVLAVLCAWVCLWRLELPLQAWALLSQGFSTLMCLGQEHLVFRDFRWDPDTEFGPLVVWKRPGLQIFLFGLLVLVATMMVFVAAFEPGKRAGRSLSRLPREPPLPFCEKLRREPRRVWQWLLLPFCLASLILGLTTPIVKMQVFWPQRITLDSHEQKAVHRFQNSTEPGEEPRGVKREKSYLELISSFYDSRLPCSALVVATNSVIYPAMQFGGLVTVLAEPPFVSEGVNRQIRQELTKRALFRFTNPFYMMILVSFLNLPGAGNVLFEALHFQASFERGFWSLLLYCITSHVLAQSLEPEAGEGGNEKVQALESSQRRMMLSSRGGSSGRHRMHGKAVQHTGSLKHPFGAQRRSLDEVETGSFDSKDSLSDAGSTDAEAHSTPWLLIATIVGLAVCIGVTMYVGLTRPFLGFSYRASGVQIAHLEPTLLELWQNLAQLNWFLGCFAASVLLFAMLLWVMLLLVVVCNPDCSRYVRFAEQATRPWVMGHVWAESIVIIYYIIRSRSKAVIEYCAEVPSPPIGMVALVAMGGSVYYLTKTAGKIVKPVQSSHPSPSVFSQLPGGSAVWMYGPALMAVSLCIALDKHGPLAPREITSLSDVNNFVSTLLPNTNDRLRRWIPESAGDCEQLYQYRVVHPDASQPGDANERKCVGKSPLVHVKASDERAMDAAALWVTGLNTLQVNEVKIYPPERMAVTTQRWNMTLSAVFTDVHVWMKVMLGNDEWVNDYLCCDSPFHFTVQASTQCTEEKGFDPLALSILAFDPIHFKHQQKFVTDDNGISTSSSIQWDYGRQDVVEKALSEFIAGKASKLLIKTSNGSTIDALSSVSNMLGDIVKLNTGRRCLPTA